MTRIRKFSLAVFMIGATSLLVPGSMSNAASSAADKGSHIEKSDGDKKEKQCDERSAKGTYGFALIGSIVGVGPIATSGTTNFDGEGSDSGEFTVTTSTTVQHFTFTGTYTVNPDCTAMPH